ncbi:DUF2142 domain-containing protein [Cellulomonas sp. P22]|uniref:DUF2142 domain-containing protein n=1 Tax=Cellulomonas sp. P22 TaxID=3373189 RepID=UPI0037A92912
MRESIVRRFTAARDGRLGTPRATFWMSFGILFVITALWSLANPLMAVVDEGSHTVKAAASARLQFKGDETGLPSGNGTFRVPELYDQALKLPNCFAFSPDTSAQCQQDLVGDLAAVTDVPTSAARYNPIYYAIVGIPSLFPSGEATLYLMRLASGLLSAALLASAFRAVAEMKRRSWLMMGLMLTVTPTVLNLASAINPQSVEIAGAIGLWVSLLALVRAPDPALLQRRLVRLTVLSVLFVNSRALSPFFLAVIVATVVLSAPWPNVKAVLIDRRSWPYLAVAFLGTVAAVVWIRAVGGLSNSGEILYPELTTNRVVGLTLEQTAYYFESLVGVFGWLDSRMPQWGYLLFAALLGTLVVIGWTLADRRNKLVLLGLGGLTLLLPVVLQASQAPYVGIVWQGRYIAPLAVGIVLLAAFSARDGQERAPERLARSLMGTVGILLAVGHVAAFTANLHRFVNGTGSSWVHFHSWSWAPPVHPAVLLGLLTLFWAGLAGYAWSVCGERRRDTAPGSDAFPSELSAKTPVIGDSLPREVAPSR